MYLLIILSGCAKYHDSLVFDSGNLNELLDILNRNKARLIKNYNAELSKRIMDRVRDTFEYQKYDSKFIDDRSGTIRITGIDSIRLSQLDAFKESLNSLSDLPVICDDIIVKNWYKGGIQLLVNLNRVL